MDDNLLEKLLYPKSPDKVTKRPLPDWSYVHKELKKKSVTLFLLWQEYKETYPDGYEYSWFCKNYKEWSGKIDVTMRFNHLAGEKLFVDYAGHTIPVIDKRTGEIRDPRSLWQPWAQAITHMQRPHGHNLSRIGSLPM